MKASIICVVALLALACMASAQPARRNATASMADDDTAMAAPKRNATGVAGAVRNATAAAGAKRANATGAGAAAAAEPVAAEPKGADAKADSKADAKAPAASPAPKKSGAAVATTGFAAAVAGSVLLLQLVL